MEATGARAGGAARGGTCVTPVVRRQGDKEETRLRAPWVHRILPLASAAGIVLWTVIGPAGTAGATGQTTNVSTTASVQCAVSLQVSPTSLSFGTIAPGQTSQQTLSEAYWTDTCGTTFTATVAATDLVDYSTGASAPTSVTSGTPGSCGGSIGCIPLYNADIGVSFAAPICDSVTTGSCGAATLPTKGTYTGFAAEGISGCPELDVTPGVDLSCPDTALTGTSGSYSPGAYQQAITFTLGVPANAQTGSYSGWLQYTITG